MLAATAPVSAPMAKTLAAIAPVSAPKADACAAIAADSLAAAAAALVAAATVVPKVVSRSLISVSKPSSFVVKAVASWLSVIAPLSVSSKSCTSGAVSPSVPADELNGPANPF